MKIESLTWLLAWPALALLGAASLPDAEDLVRQGNAAFAHGEYERAAAYYRQAEEASTDPGMVAFNKAAALFEDGQYEEAEKHYWLCLGDAGAEVEQLLRKEPDRDLPDKVRANAGRRLARTLYNLGNCVLQRSRGTDGEAVAWATVLYGHCLRLRAAEASLHADARHNLELARDLLRLHPPKPAKRDSSKEENPDEQPPKNPNEKTGSEPGDSGTEKTGPKKEPGESPDKSQGGDDKTLDKGKRSAGKGNLAVLPDSDELASLSPEQAAAFLRGAMQRIQTEERRDYDAKTSEKTSRNVLDW